MPTKVQVYKQMADETALRITESVDSWAGFLTTSARLYKYSYGDQLLIFAQRPDATACAGYNVWNDTMRRYVRRGTKGIALLAPGGNGMEIRYVFDVSDTGERRNSRPVELWQMRAEYEKLVTAMLAANHDAPVMDDLKGQIEVTAMLASVQYWNTHKSDILDSVDLSTQTEYHEDTIGASFLEAAAASISYELRSRCGMNPEVDPKAFAEILRWHTPEMVSELGKAVNMISGQVLRQIEMTVKSVERSVENDRTEVQAERGLPAAGSGTDRGGTEAPGQVRDDAPAVSGGESSGPLHETAAGRDADGAPVRDRGDGIGADGEHDAPAGEGERSDRGIESSGSDGLGRADEQPEASGRGDDPGGADLRLTDHEPLSEQMSFLFPAETEQIEIIDTMEAESVTQMPFASFIPQEVVDEILRQGGNTTDHRMLLVTDFSKGNDTETQASHLRSVYHGGNGVIVNGRQYSAWYDENGIHIAPGKSSRYVNMAQHISWNDAAKRIGEMLDSGTFASMLEIATAPIHERTLLAQSLWYLYRDISSDAAFFPSMQEIRGGGFPDETGRLSRSLADPEFAERIAAEAAEFAERYNEDRSLMRFHFHDPNKLAGALRELSLPRRDYDSLLTEIAPVIGFITEDEIEASLTSGSSVAGGKGRIYHAFTSIPALSDKEKADFLKGEYGIGGRSHAVSGSDHSGESHDSKGIELKKQSCPDVKLSWAQVAKTIQELIRKDRYLTASEKEALLPEQPELQDDADNNMPGPAEETPDEEYIGFDTEAIRRRLEERGMVNGEIVDMEAFSQSPIVQEAEALGNAAGERAESVNETPSSAAYPLSDSLHVGDTVYLDGHAFILEEKDQFGVRLRDPELVYPVFRAESLARFEQLLGQDERNTQPITSEEEHVPSPDEIKLETIVLDLSGSMDEERAPAVSEQAVPDNFRITNDHLGEGGMKTKYSFNAEAIRTLKLIEAEQRYATPEEQEVLSRYVGWGGIPQAFDDSNAAWAAEYQQLRELLTPEEYEAARASTLNAHYTSPVVIRAMYQALDQMGFRSGNILEPSCGVGNFLGMLPENMSDSRLYGVELDSITGRIARQLYPKADITVAGFETTDRKDFFDVAIGNVPFGAYKVPDRAYDRYNLMIHDYFFAKALDQVRPGGVVAFITSKGTLDKQNPEVRRYIAQRAELLGAIRLPNNAFRANAGTEVTSDIIFLQKRDRLIDIDPEWVHLGQTEDGIPVNSYFADHPEMILGTMVRENGLYGNQTETACIPIEGADLSEQLASAVQNITGQYLETETPDVGEAEEVLRSIPADPSVKNYSFTVVDGEIYYRRNSIMVQPKLSAAAQERIRGLVGLRQEVNDLIQAQMDNAPDEVIAEHQQRLNAAYDSFTARFGLINSRGNANAFAEDASYYLLCSLEMVNDKGELIRKADMFTKRTIRQSIPVTHVDTPIEALAVSIAEKARVDLDYMEELTGTDKAELVDKLTGVIFPVPNGRSGVPLFETYVTADEYLSGNVREKLREARRAAEIDPIYQPNVTALEAAQPIDLDASEIDVRLGATWVDKDYITDFMHETFSTPAYLSRYIEVSYSSYTAEWNISGKNMISGSNVAAYVTYGTDRANAYRILEDTLNLRDVRIYDTVTDPDGKERRVLNQKETTLAQQKQQAIKDAFHDWIWRNPYRREALVTRYNELFNSTRPREFDGSHIAFNGMTPEITMREHQRNAVARVLYGGNTLLAHQVGAGKTFEMIASVMEGKRLGLCQKAMFVVPNHLTEQWASEFLRLYPSANILVTTRKDFERANRQKFCARIATGDYDAVIIGHSQFERIPVSQERQERLLREQIEDITDGIRELKYHRGEQFSVKQLERAKRQLETRLKKLEAEDKKDHVVTFEQLGVDRLYVDEAQAYKNLFLFTKMRNVAGIAASEAQKSSDMFLKCRYMDEITGGRGIIFATGTPVSNSMTELYTMQRYLQYATLQKKGMSQFDCWASTFGETTTAIELAPEGTGYRARTRFSKFFNLPELMKMFSEVADIKTADQLHLPTPESHYETVVVKPSGYQQDMVQALSERAAAIHNGSVDPSTDNMLKVTSDGRKLGLDQRLIDPLLPDDPSSKVNACVANVLRIWRDSQAERLTQLVFCDISTPRGKAGNDKEQALLDAAAEETGTGSFNIYDDIRDKLVAQGVPREEIAFIHEANTEARKKELFAKVRRGEVRVLLGSTAKMGAGTNVQDRLIASHDLDCPWRPGDLEQRAGRIVRQGNQNPEVFIYRYVTEGTFDSYLWQTVENKQKFIAQIMSSKSPVRACDDVDETALSYAEIKALCAGDPRIREKMDLDVDVARLRLMKADHQSKQYRLEDQILKQFPQEIERGEQITAGYAKDIATMERYPLPEKDFVGMVVGDTHVTDKEEAGKAILRGCKEAAHGEIHRIGFYRGFDLSVQYDAFNNRFQMLLQGAITHRVDVGNDARGNLTRLDNAIAQIPAHAELAHDRLNTTRQQLEAARQELGKPFPQETELRTKSARLAELDAELNMDQHGHAGEDHERPSVLTQLKQTHQRTEQNRSSFEEVR